MSKLKHRTQLTQNQKGAMSDDPRDGARNSETLGRAGRPTALEQSPEEKAQDQEAIEEFGREGARGGER
jgi:hypothetical protein